MSLERAEAFPRQLAEAELRARTLPAARIPGRRRDPGRLGLVEPAPVAAGVVEAGPADQIRADLELAVAVRQPGQENQAGLGGSGLPPDARKQLAGLMHNPSRRAGTVAAYFPGLAAAYPRPAPHRAPWRVVPVGQVIPIPDGDVRRELLLVAYLHSADGARFTVGDGRFHGLTAVDDRRITIISRGGPPRGSGGGRHESRHYRGSIAGCVAAVLLRWNGLSLTAAQLSRLRPRQPWTGRPNRSWWPIPVRSIP